MLRIFFHWLYRWNLANLLYLTVRWGSHHWQPAVVLGCRFRSFCLDCFRVPSVKEMASNMCWQATVQNVAWPLSPWSYAPLLGNVWATWSLILVPFRVDCFWMFQQNSMIETELLYSAMLQSHTLPWAPWQQYLVSVHRRPREATTYCDRTVPAILGVNLTWADVLYESHLTILMVGKTRRVSWLWGIPCSCLAWGIW